MTPAERKKVVGQLKTWREHPAVMVRELFGVEPDPWQFDVLEAFPHQPRIALQAAKGPGKLQPKSMMFDTPTGRTRWGDIQPGDFVFAPDGTPTRVLKTFDNGVVPLYRVWFDDGSSTLCGAEHLWKVRGANERRRSQPWAVLTTEQILARGVRVKNGRWKGRQFEIPQHEAVEFKPADLAVDPYVFGVWLGDGDKCGGRYTGINHEVEEEIVRRGYRIGSVSKNGQTRWVLGLRKGIRASGMLGRGSHERFVPKLYRYASVSQRLDLLRGLMDTDGCIGDDGHMEFDSTSPQLAQDVIWLVRSLGGSAYLKETVKKTWYYSKTRERIPARDCFRVTVRTRENPFFVGYKAKRWKPPSSKSQTRYLTRYIDRIEPAAPEDSMCIQVEHSSRCYLANDFIVTHNTALLAWITWNFMLTRPTPKCAATSISGANLADNFWTEMAKWMNRAPLLQAMFEWTKTRIFAKENAKEWWISFRTWPQQGDTQSQADTLAGLHADYILFILDESGGIPDAVMVSADAALSSCVEGHIVQAGNPTNLSGPLYRAATVERRFWYVVEITGDPDNPKRSPRISVQWARDQIEKWGADNPWVLVNVFGRFPQSSLNVLIGPAEVEAAMKRYYREHEIGRVPKILGIDVARFGDDSSSVARRQGIQMFPFDKHRNLDSIRGAAIVNRTWGEWGADAAFIDATGGFGSGWEDQLRLLGRNAIGVHFSSEAHNRSRYYNKRAEMTFDFVEWIKRGGALPESQGLLKALTETTYTFQKDRLILEPKEQVKARIGFSPDDFDAAILTFAEPVSISAAISRRPNRMLTQYDPFAELDKPPAESYSEGW